ncbi:hypothetical protein C7212DRAFT_339795, partial [Tuber magnatum]
FIQSHSSQSVEARHGVLGGWPFRVRVLGAAVSFLSSISTFPPRQRMCIQPPPPSVSKTQLANDVL